MLETCRARVGRGYDRRGAGGRRGHDPPSVALLDLTLPDGDGLALVAPLLASGATRSSCSRVTTTARRGSDARCGCADVFVKPVPVRDLIDRSRRLASRRATVAVFSAAGVHALQDAGEHRQIVA